MRGNRCDNKNIKAMQVVSALSIENKFSLAEVRTHKKPNEIKAIPILLGMLDVHFNDDGDKRYEMNSAENFAQIKRLILNLIKAKEECEIESQACRLG